MVPIHKCKRSKTTQIWAQLMTDAIYNKQGPTRLYYGIRVMLTVFTALTNCFHKKILVFMSFPFICYTFCSPMT